MDTPTPTTLNKFHALVEHIFNTPGVSAAALVQAFNEVPLVYLVDADEHSVRPYDASKMTGEARESAIIMLADHTRISVYPMDDKHTLVLYTPVGDSVSKSLARLARRFKVKYEKMVAGGAP